MTDFTSPAVAVGLDLHASSIRLAAVRADELLASARSTMTTRRSSVSSHAGRVLAAATRAGPTGFGLHRHLTAAVVLLVEAARHSRRRPKVS